MTDTKEARTRPMAITKTTSVTVGSAQLRALITDLLRTSGMDETLPMLMGVRFHADEFNGETVFVGLSTDRFTVGQAHVRAAGHLPEVFVPAASCQRLLAVLKLLAPEVSVDLAVTGDVELSLTADDLTAHVPTSAVDFPKLAGVFAAMANEVVAPGGTPVAFDPKLIARFAAIAKDRREHLVVSHTSANRPAVITIGDSYRGVIMPVRQSDGQERVSWLLAPSETVAIKAAEAAKAAAEAKAKRSAASKKAAATRKANAGTTVPRKSRAS